MYINMLIVKKPLLDKDLNHQLQSMNNEISPYSVVHMRQVIM